MGKSAGLHFEVRIADKLLNEDLANATQAARAAIEPVIELLRADGVPVEWLRRCQSEGRDGTQLEGCVKFRIPHPGGPWGAVLRAGQENGAPILVLLAVGVRHPTKQWRPSVYEIASRRLDTSSP